MAKKGWQMILAGCLVICLLWATGAQAGITYDAASKAIIVLDYPAEKPATMQEVLAADRAGKWGVVSYDQATDAYTVAAHLWVGSDDGTKTYFQIGTKTHPKEAVVMKGDLWVKMPKKKAWQTYLAQNGLVVGDPADAAIKPVMKFDCSKNGEFSLRIDEGNKFYLYNATLTAVTPDLKHLIGLQFGVMAGGDLRMVDSTISWFSNLYGLETVYGIVRGMVFEHGSVALSNGGQYVEDSVFRDLGIAVHDGGGMDATLVNCRFENNGHNWTLQYTSRGIRAIDCTFGEQKEKDLLITRYRYPGGDRWNYPLFFSQRHVVFEVKDQTRNLVADAVVTVVCEQDDVSAVAVGQAKTAQDGKTPGAREAEALLVTDHLIRATEDPKAPLVQNYTYKVTVKADGFAPMTLTGIDPDQSWQMKSVVLKKK